MTNLWKTGAGLAPIALLVILAVGCQQQGPAQQAGEKVDAGVQQAGEAVQQAGEAMEKKLEHAAEQAKKTTQ